MCIRYIVVAALLLHANSYYGHCQSSQFISEADKIINNMFSSTEFEDGKNLRVVVKDLKVAMDLANYLCKYSSVFDG